MVDSEPKSKIRVLMLTWEYPPYVVGGLGAHVAALAPALARAGVQVHVVTPRWRGGEAREILDQGKAHNSKYASAIYRVEPPMAVPTDFFADVQQTNLNLGEQGGNLFRDLGGFDIIHAHDWLTAWSGEALKRLFKVPLIATIHATERGRGRGTLSGETAQAINGAEWWLTYEAWRLIATSQFMAKEIESYFKTPADKVSIVANGVDTAIFDKLIGVDLAPFRNRWARTEEKIVFFVGRLVEEKGAHLIVEAAPRVLAQIPNVRFIIAGNGPMSEHIQRRAYELGIASKVNVAGFIADSERDRLLRVADAAIYPSLYEPFGIVALEAMAAHCPVIVGDVGGLGEVVTHDVDGVKVNPGDIESIARGIVYTLSYPESARQRTERAYQMVKQEYNWDYIAQKTIEVYRRIIEERIKTNW